jgi:hypothetical protein
MKTNSNFHFRAITHCLKAHRLFWALPILVGLLLAVMPMVARRAGASAAQQGGNAFWETVEPVAHEARGNAAAAQLARVFRLREQVMRAALQQAGPERAGQSEQPAAVIALPLPDGSFARFSVVEAPVLSAQLAAQYPELKSYRGQGLDNPGLAVWCSWTPLGLRAWVRDGAETLRIQPLTDTKDGLPLDYVSLAERVEAEQAQDAACFAQIKEMASAHARRLAPERATNFSVGPTLRTYRLALATTTNYTQTYGGNTEAGTTPTLVDLVLGVNAIYGSELAIQFTLVTNGNLILRNGGPAPPQTIVNGDAAQMADSGRALFKAKLSESSYDLGMLLGTGSGGTAYIGVVCENAADTFGPYKGGAAVLISGLLNDANNKANMVRLIAHEIGHQFGAMHTQNANCAGAGTGRFGDTAVEPGGGLSLMSNAGNCAGDEIATAREAFFHATSFMQINQFLSSFVSTNCATTSTIMNGQLENGAPMITSKTPNYTIPKGTPFTLTAQASDPNGDSLTYAWEQVDAGGADFPNPPYMDGVNDQNSTRPLFRPFLPNNNGVRNFPSLTYVPPSGLLSGENLPQVARTLNFRVTVRDGHGGVSNDAVQLTVEASVGPFDVGAVTGPWMVGTTRTITWQTGNTNFAPLYCTAVKISLSIDGGNSFPYMLAATTPNDGSEVVSLPTNIPATTSARVKIEAIGNIFFDVTDANFMVQVPSCIYSISAVQASFPKGNANQSGTVNVITLGSNCTWTATSDEPSWLTITNGSNGSGNGTITYSVSPNNSAGTPTRTGRLSIAGQTFTVTQEGSLSGYQYIPLPAPVRLLDTRPGASPNACSQPNAPITGGTSRTQSAWGTCNGQLIPNTARAITGNITTVNSGGGYLTLYPSDAAQPTVSNSNYGVNEVLNNVFTVGLGTSDGAFKIYVTTNTDMVVDVTGYYVPLGATGGLYFHPLPAPIRLLETRAGAGLSGCYRPDSPIQAVTDRLQPGRITCDGVTIPNAAQTLVGNATVVNNGAGFLTLYPAGVTRPLVASSNFNVGQVMNAPFTVGLSAAGEFNIYSTATTDLIVDVLGYYSAEANDVNGAGLLFTSLASPVRLLETRSTPANLPGCFKPNAPLAANSTRTQPARGVCEGQTIPTTALGVVGNATVVFPATLGYLTFWSSSAMQPTVATSNFTAGQVFNRHFTVGLGNADGAFKIFTNATTELVVDVAGYFAP